MRSLARRHMVQTVLAALLVVGLASCSSDGQIAQDLPDVSLPDVSLPDAGADGGGASDGGDVETGGGDDAAAPADAGTSDANGSAPTDTTSSSDDGLDPTTLIVLIAIAVLVLIMFVYRSGKSSAQAGQDQRYQSDLRRRLDSVLRSAAWADDQAAQVTVTTDPNTLAAVQGSLASQFVQAESECATLTVDIEDEPLRAAVSQLGTALASLRGSLAAPVSEANDEVWHQVVEHRRIDLSHARQRVVETITTGNI